MDHLLRPPLSAPRSAEPPSAQPAPHAARPRSLEHKPGVFHHPSPAEAVVVRVPASAPDAFAPRSFAPRPAARRGLAESLPAPTSGVLANGRPTQWRSILPHLPRSVHGRQNDGLTEPAPSTVYDWLVADEPRRQEAMSHAASPLPLMAWRLPQEAALLTVPLPAAHGLNDASMRLRARPQMPAPRARTIVVASASLAAPAAVPPAQGGPQKSETSARLDGPGVSGAVDGAQAASAAPSKGPTTLLLALASPRVQRQLPGRDLKKEALAQERARTKRRFAAFAKRLEKTEQQDARDETPSEGGLMEPAPRRR